MKRLLQIAMGLWLFLQSAHPGHAQISPTDWGPYIGAIGGVNHREAKDVKGVGANLEPNSKMGYLAGLIVGLEPKGWPLRLELEATRRGHRFKNVFNKSGGDLPGLANREIAPLQGNLSVWSFMANSYVTFPVPIGVTPRLGLGVGYTQVSFNDLRVRQKQNLLDDSSGGWGYQLLVDVDLDFIKADPLKFALQYRFFGAPDMEFRGVERRIVRYEYQSHGFSMSARWKF